LVFNGLRGHLKLVADLYFGTFPPFFPLLISEFALPNPLADAKRGETNFCGKINLRNRNANRSKRSKVFTLPAYPIDSTCPNV
jgi:hypothetical protein